jgi:hypothetical protein
MTGAVYSRQRTDTGEDAYLVLEQLGEAARAEIRPEGFALFSPVAWPFASPLFAAAAFQLLSTGPPTRASRTDVIA